jgi:hypothetical protein
MNATIKRYWVMAPGYMLADADNLPDAMQRADDIAQARKESLFVVDGETRQAVYCSAYFPDIVETRQVTTSWGTPTKTVAQVIQEYEAAVRYLDPNGNE